jgi:hypothetical protein
LEIIKDGVGRALANRGFGCIVVGITKKRNKSKIKFTLNPHGSDPFCPIATKPLE